MEFRQWLDNLIVSIVMAMYLSHILTEVSDVALSLASIHAMVDRPKLLHKATYFYVFFGIYLFFLLSFLKLPTAIQRGTPLIA